MQLFFFSVFRFCFCT